ncbi:putative MFS family arabinose efflux permease [Thermocatellispora tengchongensis]|uniref:Putative MFS family arabinose efflux permease n=1 Tax=Thermocatellispora tengchongensis TaxID=1073253 RepID=A0A840PC38_9ACTN|nr:MFS transporter [Thermocatellispora tengchongensis]MBB5138984.1 putative MFS family arabinose efflux permease [Thermocatellispora tengchongensis]
MNPPTPERRAETARARVATCLLFLLSGLAIGTWTSRIPAIKDALGLTDGLLSVGLLGIAAGAIAGMQAVGRLVDRHGSRRVMIPAALAQGAVLVLPGVMPNLPALVAALLVFGAVHGALDVSMNAGAVDVERAAGRPLMSSFHAVFSLGGFLGAALGAGFAHAGLSPALTFLAAGVLIAAMAAWAAAWALPAAAPSTTAPSAAPDGPATDGRTGGRGVLFLGVLAFCCLVGEGAAADWSTVYVRFDLGASASLAAMAYAAFSIAMMAGRLAGDRLAAWLGPVTLVRACGALATGGLGAALLIGHPIAALIGFGLFGAGLSCIVPQVFSAAGHRDPAQAGRALARVASIGYAGFLSGPVLIGGVAEPAGLPRALAIPVVLAMFVALTATALRVRASAGPRPAPDRLGSA